MPWRRRRHGRRSAAWDAERRSRACAKPGGLWRTWRKPLVGDRRVGRRNRADRWISDIARWISPRPIVGPTVCHQLRRKQARCRSRLRGPRLCRRRRHGPRLRPNLADGRVPAYTGLEHVNGASPFDLGQLWLTESSLSRSPFYLGRWCDRPGAAIVFMRIPHRCSLTIQEMRRFLSPRAARVAEPVSLAGVTK
jgi:hypothetical protein